MEKKRRRRYDVSYELRRRCKNDLHNAFEGVGGDKGAMAGIDELWNLYVRVFAGSWGLGRNKRSCTGRFWEVGTWSVPI